MSPKTISLVYQRLQDEGLVVKRGRKWYAGESEKQRMTGKPPVIIVIQTLDHTWRTLGRQEWSRPFVDTFLREAHGLGFQIIPVVIGAVEDNKRSLNIKKRIAALISQFGRRYRGTLLLGRYFEFKSYARWKIDECVTWLGQFDKPIVWIDMIDEAGENGVTPASRSERYVSMIQNKKLNSLFSRCCPDEFAAARIVIETLAGMGHQKLGFVRPAGREMRWVTRRMEYLMDVASRHSHITLLNSEQKNGLKKNTGILVSQLLDKGVSALIVSNDAEVGSVCDVLSEKDLSLPDDIGLISFDADEIELFPNSVSSIDFGFSYLGYRAFHIIVNDIPKMKSHGVDIRAVPQLNHTGSIGVCAK